MRLTLLEIVQSTLSAMDSDEVDSIDKNAESRQVAGIARDCFFELISNRHWPHLSVLTNLSSGNSYPQELPTHYEVHSSVVDVEFLNYDCSKDPARAEYQEVIYLSPDDFLRNVNSRGNSVSVVQVTDPSGVVLNITNNQPPTYYTSFDDKVLVFDSWDASVDSTITANKIQAKAYTMASWVHDNDHIPNLPEEAFSMYLAEVKATAFFEVKQMVNERQQEKRNRQQRWLSQKGRKVGAPNRYASFGRRSKK